VSIDLLGISAPSLGAIFVQPPAQLIIRVQIWLVRSVPKVKARQSLEGLPICCGNTWGRMGIDLLTSPAVRFLTSAVAGKHLHELSLDFFCTGRGDHLMPNGPAVQLPAPVEGTETSVPQSLATPERPCVGRSAATACWAASLQVITM